MNFADFLYCFLDSVTRNVEQSRAVGTVGVVISAAFCCLSQDMTFPLPDLVLGWEENDSSYLPSILTRLASCSVVLLQSQISKVPDCRNYASTLGSIRRNRKDPAFSCWSSNFQTLQDLCFHWRQIDP